MGMEREIWSEDLTDAQLSMVIESGCENYGEGFGVELRGSARWRVARNLEKLGLGDIEGGAPNGSSLPGLYFNNSEGARIVNEFAEDDEDTDDCPFCDHWHGVG